MTDTTNSDGLNDYSIYVDVSGAFVIEAESAHEAEQKFRDSFEGLHVLTPPDDSAPILQINTLAWHEPELVPRDEEENFTGVDPEDLVTPEDLEQVEETDG